MGAPDLPPDVLHKLLDQLLDDKRTLSSCALVCRAWLQIARPLLFHSINVRIGLANRAGFVDQLAVFDAFLQETPQLGVLVRRLALANALEDLYKGRGRPAVKLPVLAPVLAKLPNLIHLSFHSVSLVSAPQLPPLSLHLDRLELFHVLVARNPLPMYGAAILDLLCLFSSIHTLSLIPSISPSCIIQPVFVALKPIPVKVRVCTLSVLDIVKRGYDLALALLINALDFSSITRFTSRINSVDDLLPVGGVLRRMVGLRELELRLSCEEPVSQSQWSILSLSTLTSLRSLTLNVTLTPTSVTSGFRAFRSIVPLILSLSVPLPTTPDSRPDSTASTPRPLEPAAGTLASATTSLSNHAHTSNASNASESSCLSSSTPHANAMTICIHLHNRTASLSPSQMNDALDNFKWYTFAGALSSTHEARGLKDVKIIVYPESGVLSLCEEEDRFDGRDHVASENEKTGGLLFSGDLVDVIREKLCEVGLDALVKVEVGS